jgi:anti-sigma factor RsiW
MHCSEANQQLQYYVDGQLPIPQIHLLEAHISSCTACQNELRLLQEVVDRLHDLQSVAEPTYMTMRIMERVAMCPQRTRKADRD